MTKKEFIEKAIEGGWKQDEKEFCTISFLEENGCNGEMCFVIDNTYSCHITGERKGKTKHYQTSQIILDPKAWEAVGKVEGWQENRVRESKYEMAWQCEMHQMIDALIEGKTIEEYLETL